MAELSASHRLFRILTPLLLFLGLQCWLIFYSDYGKTFQLRGLVLCFLLTAVGSLLQPWLKTREWLKLAVAYAALAGLLEWGRRAAPTLHLNGIDFVSAAVGVMAASSLPQKICRLSPRAVLGGAAVLIVIGTIYFPATAWRQGRNFLPKWQDELSYRIQFQQLAHGRLWYPPHPLADFFDTFQVLVQPVYASIYFPGPSLLYAPALLAHLPLWMVSSLIAGLTLAAVFLLFSELLDPLAGLLAALMLVGNTMFRKLAIMTFGYPLIVLLTVVAAYFWLRWRKQPSLRRAWPIGVALGWAAITRPLDAIIVALPIGIDALWLAWRGRRSSSALHSEDAAGMGGRAEGASSLLEFSAPRLPPAVCPKQGKGGARFWLVQSAVVVVAAAPFILLQLVFNLGVTSKVTFTPFELYAQRDYPDTTFGFHAYDPAHRPVSVVPQKQKFHDDWTAPAVRRHTPANVIHNWLYGSSVADAKSGAIAATFDNLMPNRYLILLVPLGFTALTAWPRTLLFLMLPGYVLLYSFYAFSLPQYAMIAWSAVTLLILLGVERVADTWRRTAHFFRSFFIAVIVLLSLTETAELNPYIRDEAFNAGGLAVVDQRLAELAHQPSIVLFRFPPDGNPHEEPVYNVDVPWPDQARVIRAHDLGQRNQELFRYYADRQPERAVYRFDRKDESIAFLGFVKDLAAPSP